MVGVITSLVKDLDMYAKALLGNNYKELDYEEVATKLHYALNNPEEDDFVVQGLIGAVLLHPDFCFFKKVHDYSIASKTLKLEPYDMIMDPDKGVYGLVVMACKVGVWLKPLKDGRTTTAKACVEQMVKSRGIPAYFYESNLDKNRANYNTMSMDSATTEDEDMTIGDLIESPKEFMHRGSGVDSVVQMYINNNRIIEAVILDSIAYTDCLRKIKDDQGHSKTELWRRQLVLALNELSEKYIKDFESKYTIKSEKLEAAVTKITHSRNVKLYTYIDELIADARANLDVQYALTY